MPNHLKHDFLQPGDLFSPLPFWFWNDELDETELRRQILDFKDKGINGFVIHPRIGLPVSLTYLSDRFMAYVRFAVDLAAENAMKVVLYDEGMYPSGSAHGLVVHANPEYASRGLAMRIYPVSDGQNIELPPGKDYVAVMAVRMPDGQTVDAGLTVRLAARPGRIDFNPPDPGSWSVLVFEQVFSQGAIRGIHPGEDDGEPGAPASADLLNASAVRTFIELTHERYYSVLQDHFGQTVIGMFTDEPNILGRNHLAGLLPWTSGFLSCFLDQGNRETDLPALWLDAGEQTAEIRRRYWRAVNRKLADSYYQPLSRWCADHHIALTGHPEKSDQIGLMDYFQIPAQDIVWRWVAPEDEKGIAGEHSTMAKCSADAARHAGRRRNGNECFGACGPGGVHWAFSADDMKWYLDWLFVRGVNLIFPHAFYYSVAGRLRYGERPPDVGPNNIWWPSYRTISDYMKRLSWLLTDSVNQAGIAVLCGDDQLPWSIVRPLYEQQLEFNYLETGILTSERCRINGGVLQVAGQAYKIIVAEDAGLLTVPVLAVLRTFARGGGQVIIHDPQHLLADHPEFEKIDSVDQVLQALKRGQIAARSISLSPPCRDLRVSHLIKDGQTFYLLVNEGERAVCGRLTVADNGLIERWDPWRGRIEPWPTCPATDAGQTVDLLLERRSSLILAVNPLENQPACPPAGQMPTVQRPIWKTLPINGSWEISGLPGREPFSASQLTTWNEWIGSESFCGSADYRTDFYWQPENTGPVLLDLGIVRELAQVEVNGWQAGTALWDPYVLEITAGIKPGWNTISIRVTNSRANNLVWSGLKTGLPSGLLGPVTIRYAGS